MPNTTSSIFTTFTAATKAKASEVNDNFDFSEFNLWPHVGGVKTDNAFYLGDTDAAWIGLYTHSLDPLGVTGVAIGTTTVANASDVAFEVAGAKAILVSRLTLTERDALTPINGMFIYNSTDELFNIYENGAWQTMGEKIGYVHTSTSFTAATTITAHSGSGRIKNITTAQPAGDLRQLDLSMTVDGVGYTINGATNATGFVAVIIDDRNTTTAFRVVYTTAAFALPQDLDIFFKTSFELKGTAVNANSITVHYEKS